MAINSLQELLVDELRDIYDAEKRLTKAIPKLIKASTSEDLQDGLENHLTETEGQVSRLERAFEEMGEQARAKTCLAMKGLIEEGDETAGEDFGDDSLRDAAIIGAAQRVEHYEIAAYGTAIAHARLLGLDEVVNLLEESLQEEKAANNKLTEVAEGIVNPEALTGEDEESTDTRDNEMATTSRGGNSMRAGSKANGKGRK